MIFRHSNMRYKVTLRSETDETRTRIIVYFDREAPKNDEQISTGIQRKISAIEDALSYFRTEGRYRGFYTVEEIAEVPEEIPSEELEK